ncbi:8342_t:CDS:2 [Cetraspora pellucida]|uniref:8342_t:CDS:1 n=1 Tax=Cetraspora pellucida TaxID=1433469 RepID=A0A9N9D8S3_9GLOM|nr:8342_t:CDS:2 [Cetraspora pellucida]
MSVHPVPPLGIPTTLTAITGKRVKPIETCDNCKTRKVKCDKERPQCGTCRKSKRECKYELSESSKRGRPKNEVEILQEQIEDIQNIQYHQLNQVESLLKMAVLPGAQETISMGGDNNALGMNFMMPNNSDQINGNFSTDEGWNNFYPPLTREESPPPSLNLDLSGDTLMFFTEFKPTKSDLPTQDIPDTIPITYDADIAHQSEDPVDQLAAKFKSSLYVGPSSLLTLNDDGEEQLIPQNDFSDLSLVEDQLKVLPVPEIAESLIDVYYQTAYRHYPHLKKKVVLDCFKELSRPQHFLLLNSVFFAASPFHPDTNLPLLQTHCLKTPHVLTVISLFILGLHVRKTGIVWIYNGIVSKMLFELGLHRKVKSDQISDEVKEMRDMAFWGFLASETWLSACYGRPSAIDESTCDVDLLPIPSDPNPDEETRLHIAWILHINLLRIFAQVRKYLHGWTKIAGSSREENQFRFLDATLGKWFYTLPHWLKFEEMAQDPKGSFLGAIGGEMHTLFWIVLILLHSRNLTMFTSDHSLDDSKLPSQTICVHAAIILLHCLDVLMNTVPNFYEQSCTALFAFAPAIRVLSWTAKCGDSKAKHMVQRLNEIKKEVAVIARQRFVDQTTGEGRLDGEEKLKGSLSKFKAYEEQATLDSEKQKDTYIKYRKSPIPTWGDDTNDFQFTFNLPDNFNNSQYLSPQSSIGGDQQNYQQSTIDNLTTSNTFYDSISSQNASTSIFTNLSVPQNPDLSYNQQTHMPIFGNNDFNF